MTAPQFRDLAEFLGEAEPISLPIGGTVYEFPGAVSGRVGLLITKMLDAMTSGGQAGAERAAAELDPELVELLTDEQEQTVHDAVFGGRDLDLVRDGHDSRVIRHVFLTLVAWHGLGPEAAVAAWESAGNVPAPANRAARRRGSRAPSAAAATTTRKPTRGSGTRATPPARRSPGRTSSGAGSS